MSKHDFEFTRHLVNSEEEYMGIFKELDYQEIEKILCIEFAFVDGTFHSDFTFDGINEDNEDQEIGYIYRKFEHSIFPKSYPCLVLLLNFDSFDRFGAVKIQDLEFVYPHEIESIQE